MQNFDRLQRGHDDSVSATWRRRQHVWIHCRAARWPRSTLVSTLSSVLAVLPTLHILRVDVYNNEKAFVPFPCHCIALLFLRPCRWGGFIKLAAVSVCLSVCPVPRPNSRTERPRKPIFDRMEAHHTSNLWTYLEVKRSKVKGQGRKVTWRVWQVLAHNSRTKRPRNTKIGGNAVHLMGSFKVKGRYVKVTRPTNAETGSASYLPNGKAYELQTW